MRQQSDKTEIGSVFKMKVTAEDSQAKPRQYPALCRSLWGVNWHHTEKYSVTHDKPVPHFQEYTKQKLFPPGKLAEMNISRSRQNGSEQHCWDTSKQRAFKTDPGHTKCNIKSTVLKGLTLFPRLPLLGGHSSGAMEDKVGTLIPQ